MVRFVAYLRKSTDEEKRQILSLISQRREVRTFAENNRLSLTTIFEESKTAKEPGRPVFNQMLDMIEHDKADGILCWDVDRLYRNPVDEGRVRWMLQRGIIKSIRTPHREYGPQDAGLLMAIEGGRASDYIIRLRRNVMRGVEDKLLSGGWPGGVKSFGFIYAPDLRNIAPDPIQAPIVKEAFERFSEGRYGLESMADWLAERGAKTKSGKPWSKSKVYWFLTNKLYAGIMVWKGRVFEGRYQAIVSPELFSKVATALKIRSKPRKVRTRHDFPLRGIFRCSCGSMLSAQIAKGHGGTYRYYRCSRKTGACSEPYIQERAITEQCATLLAPLGISPTEAEVARRRIAELAQKDDTEIECRLSSINAHLTDVQQQLDRLTKGYTDRLIDDDSYTKMAADYMLQKKALKLQRKQSQEQHGNNWIEPVKDAIEAFASAAKQQTTPDPQDTSNLVRKFGTNHRYSRKTVGWQLVPPFDFVAKLLADRGGQPVASQLRPTLLPSTSSLMCSIIDYLRTFFISDGGSR